MAYITQKKNTGPVICVAANPIPHKSLAHYFASYYMISPIILCTPTQKAAMPKNTASLFGGPAMIP